MKRILLILALLVVGMIALTRPRATATLLLATAPAAAPLAAGRKKDKAPQKRIRHDEQRPFQLREVVTDNLPDGVCGQIVGVGLRYNQPDWYGTRFRPGCLAKTGEKVRAGKVKFYADHTYRTTHHIGVVRSLEDVADDVLVRADILDTESGRSYLEYAKACLAAGAQTGLSIGFYERESERVEIDGTWYLDFIEVELEEFSGTPNNAVDDADLLAARHGPERAAVMRTALDTLLRSMPESEVRAAVAARFGTGDALPSTDSSAAAATSTAPNNADGTDSRSQAAGNGNLASMDDRLKAVRQSFTPASAG